MSRKKTTNEIASSSCVDRISDLPENVNEYILEKLEIWDVVRTSVLSKKWRRNWTSLPHLRFSDLFTLRYKECFESVISRVLFQRIGSIPKFSLTLHGDIPDTSGMIIPWLCFLSKSGVRDLTLDLYYSFDEDDDCELLILPSYFFSCSELRVLSLCNCLFRTPFAFNGFRSLTSLTCRRVSFEGLCFESVISLCPLIQELTLANCHGLERVLSIVAPKLRVFDIHDIFKVDYITFKNTQNLSSLSIALHVRGYPAKERKRSYISEFFSCLRNLENLTLRGGCIVRILSSGAVPKRLPTLLNFLKDLKIKLFNFENLDAISCLLCIIRSSPNLQLLDIHVDTSNRFDGKFLSNLELQVDYLDCSLDHLHTIKLSRIYGVPAEMLIIKFLLATSPSLKNMVIQIDLCPSKEEFWISTELLKFCRASACAKVTLIRGDENVEVSY